MDENIVARASIVLPTTFRHIYLLHECDQLRLQLKKPRHNVSAVNRQSQVECETVRDVILLHHHATRRDDSAFWRDLAAMPLPDRLADKIALFHATRTLTQDPVDIFKIATPSRLRSTCIPRTRSSSTAAIAD